jgi:hypothetical protein
MLKKLVVIVAATANLAACAPTLAEQPATASAADQPTCESQPANASGAWVIEGFGGKGDPQLMMTEQRPIVRCARGLPVARTATLAPLQ